MPPGRDSICYTAVSQPCLLLAQTMESFASHYLKHSYTFILIVNNILTYSLKFQAIYFDHIRLALPPTLFNVPHPISLLTSCFLSNLLLKTPCSIGASVGSFTGAWVTYQWLSMTLPPPTAINHQEFFH